MQGYFTGGLYIFLGLVGLIFFGKDYFINDQFHTLDTVLSMVAVLVGIGFSINTYFEIKKEGKGKLHEARGCFLPESKKK